MAPGRYPGAVFRRLAGVMALAALAVLGCQSAPRDTGRATDADCQLKLKADEAAVRTDHHWTDKDVPGIGSYVDIHWQLKALGNPCSRAPGPTDWQYQGLVALAPPDAAALAKTVEWQPSSSPPAWPALATLIPPGTNWTRNSAYPDLYVDAAKALAFFTLADR